MNPIRQLVIIGAGAAGLMAAITAAREGNKVLLLEKQNHVGIKLLATGDGKGNLTNTNIDVAHYHGHNPEFVQPALERFDFYKTWDFFEELGIKLCITEKGRVFPYSTEAQIIQRMLASEIEKQKVEVHLGVEIMDIDRIGSNFEIKMKHAPSVYAQKVILSTGGLAAPQLGATGDGYQWSARLGHHIEPQFPSLVQLNTHLKGSTLLNKTKITDAIISLFINQKEITNKKGDLLFIPNGVSGSAVFDLSRVASEALYRQQKVAIQINFVPDLILKDLITFFQKKKKNHPQQSLQLLLGGVLPDKLSCFILKSMQIDLGLPIGALPDSKIDGLIQIMTHFYIPVTGTQSWKYAQVTCGGISVSEVNPKNMESKIVPHLYFAGEILDVDGDCGGYNLQWAWSSGYLAGKSVVENV
jgi:predicted Rossmann fold flavoprotein